MYYVHFFNKTRALVLFLGFQYFESRTIYEFQYSVVSLFIDNGVGLVLSIWFILALVLSSKNNFIIAKLTILVWHGV